MIVVARVGISQPTDIYFLAASYVSSSSQAMRAWSPQNSILSFPRPASCVWTFLKSPAVNTSANFDLGELKTEGLWNLSTDYWRIVYEPPTVAILI